MNKESWAKLIIVAFAVYAAWMMSNAEYLAAQIFSGNLFNGMLLYLVTNPSYFIIVAGIMATHKGSRFKAFIAGLSVGLAFDIVALPVLPQVLPACKLACLAATKSAIMSPDLILAQAALNANIPYSTFHFVYYWFLPVSLMILALWLLGYASFLDRMRGKS